MIFNSFLYALVTSACPSLLDSAANLERTRHGIWFHPAAAESMSRRKVPALPDASKAEYNQFKVKLSVIQL